MKTFAMTSLGCKVNSYESNALARMFEAADYFQVDFKEIADVYIINTCTVTNTGDAKSRKMIRQAIKRNPKAIICAFGCYAQVSPDEILEIEGVDIVLGTQYRHQLVELVEKHDKSQQFKKVDDILKVKDFEDFGITSHTSNQRAFLKIQEGCNKFCSYCIIPYARGLMRSRSRDSIIKEANDLVANGYNEIVLTGIHTGGYGEDLTDYNFDNLLNDILNEVPRLKRLRISSIEINQITSQTLELFKNNKVLVPHLHIPIQAGSQTILEKMRRHYSKQEFADKIAMIREAIPGIAITTDLIVGFPGEDEKLFEESYEFAKECNFSEIHVFPYSQRKKTPAAMMENQVKEQDKSARVARMIDLSNKMHEEYVEACKNEIQSVIVEGYDEDGYSHGHSENYLKIYFKGEFERGSIQNVKIIEHNKFIIGEVV